VHRMKQQPDVIAGSVHNMILNATRDTVHGFKVLPGLILSMLDGDQWRRLVRPVDGAVFTHETVEEWVLGEPWGGLNFPSWDSLYAVLKRAESGREAMHKLVEIGAPANGVAADAREVAATGRPLKGEQHSPLGKGASVDRTVAKLKRDNPALAAQVIAGQISAHAAAIEAGFRKPTWTAPADPERLAAAIVKRYPGWRLVRA